MQAIWIIATAAFLFGAADESTIDYDIVNEGPRVKVEGIANLQFTESQGRPCLLHTFSVPEGRLAGPVISSDPGQPMLRFDEVWRDSDGLTIQWCETIGGVQTLPCWLPRYFVFYVIRTEFGPDDVPKLLSEWGDVGSAWDLNNDGTVDGADLAILLAGWKASDDGAST